MIDLKKNTLLRETPNNLLHDEKVVNLTKSLQSSLDKMFEWAEKINYTMNLEQADDAVLDHLLWEKRITWFDGLALIDSREQKIKFIQNAVKLHRLKGTPAAIELVCELLNVNTRLQEWFEYDGDPYHFKIEVMEISDRGLNEDTINLLERLVMEYKNVRSSLEAINIFFTSKHKPCVAATCYSGEEITIYPFVPEAIEIRGSYNIGAANTSYETTTIYPMGGNAE